jgi:hypothetical protein
MAARSRPVQLDGRQFYLSGSFFARALTAFPTAGMDSAPDTASTGYVQALLMGR